MKRTDILSTVNDENVTNVRNYLRTLGPARFGSCVHPQYLLLTHNHYFLYPINGFHRAIYNGTYLLAAIRNSHYEMVELLICEAHVSPTIEDIFVLTDSYIGETHTEILKLLLTHYPVIATMRFHACTIIVGLYLEKLAALVSLSNQMGPLDRTDTKNKPSS